MSRARFRYGLDEMWVVRRRDVIGLQSEARVRSFLDALREQEPTQFADLLEGRERREARTRPFSWSSTTVRSQPGHLPSSRGPSGQPVGRGGR